MKLNSWLLCLILLYPFLAHELQAQPAVAYSVNTQESSLSVYDVLETGALRYRRHHVLPKAPAAVIMHPNGKFLYAAGKSSDEISIYRIADDSGELTETPDSPVTINARSLSDLVFHPTGSYLYAAARYTGVAALAVDARTGALTEVPGSPYAAQERTRAIALHPSGRFLYATNAYSNSVSVFTIDAADGRLLPQPTMTVTTGQAAPVAQQALRLQDMPATGGGVPYMITVHPNGRFAFVSNWAGASISVFAIDELTGALSLLHGKPVATELNPYVVTVHPSGRYLYVGYWGDHKIAGYRIHEQDGKLTPLPGSPFDSAGVAPVAITCTDTRRCYVVNSWSNSITTMQVARDGALQALTSNQTRSGPVDLVFRSLTGTGLNRDTGLLLTSGSTGQVAWWSPARGQVEMPVVTLPAFVDIAVYPGSGLAYLIPAESSALIAYRMTDSGQAWSKEMTLPLAARPRTLLADRRLGYLYVYDAAGDVSAYRIDNATAALQKSAYVLHPGSEVVSLALDASSRYLYTAAVSPAMLRLFRYGDAWGPIMADMTTYGPPVTPELLPVALLTDPSANFLLVAGKAPNGLLRYRHHFQSGLLDTGSRQFLPLSGEPLAMAINGRSDSLAVITEKPNQLLLFTLHNLGGELRARDAISLSGKPKAVQAGDHGIYVLMTGEIQVYIPAAATGTMTLRRQIPLGFPVNNIELVPLGR